MIIEKILIEYLMDKLDTDAVYAEIPEDAGDTFILIQKTGSSTKDRIMTSTVAVQSYGPSLLDAMELNEQVKNAMDGLVVRPEIGSCRLNSDYDFTNAAKKQHRYQAVYNITHY